MIKFKKQAKTKFKKRNLPKTTGNQQATRFATRVKANRRSIKPKLRIIPLGGLEEVGKNMTLYEYGNEMFIVDMGLMFPTDSMLGIDYVIPDITYVKKNQHKLKGLVITHGHLDHIGAIPYILPKLGKLKIYGTPITIAFVKDRLEEFGMLNLAELKTFKPEDKIKLGSNLTLEFFSVNHSIPEAVSIITKSPNGVVVQTGDFKFDHTPVDGQPADMGRIAQIGSQGVSLLLSDSTNAEKPGHAISESKVGRNIDQVFDDNKDQRIIFATFSTLISRIQQAIKASVNHGRKIAVSGRSMEKSVRIVSELGYMQVPKNSFVTLRQAKNIPPSKITILTTGSQGEEASSLYRMSLGTHREIKVTKNDSVIISSSPIPGNERSVYGMMDNLFRLGANVLYDKIIGLHTSGHGRQEDLKLMIALLKPKYIMPVHGEYHMLAAHRRLAQSMGWDHRNVFTLGNGQILELDSRGQARLSKETVPARYVMVDGLGVGDIGNVVLRDRQVMAKDGMFVVIMLIDRKTGALLSEPSIVSRGFIYVKESDELMTDAKRKIKEIMDGKTKSEISANWPILKKQIRDELGLFLFKKTERRPIVLPVIMEA